MRKHKKLFKIFVALTLIIILYFTVCFGLYLFEPIYYNSTDLSKSQFSFELYDKFSYDKNSEFYIKQISADDIVACEDDIRLKYVDDTILVISEPDVTETEMTSLFDLYDAELCGYIDIINFYQITVETATYNELENICSVLNGSELVKCTLVDYFEETPENEYSTDVSAPFMLNKYYYEMLDVYDSFEHSVGLARNITVGIFDVPVYYEHAMLNVVNSDEYSAELLNSDLLANLASHGTHVAGIVAAESNNEATGVIPGAGIYSDNAVNNSISYWIAAITNMIAIQNIKAINISMGYNSYIPVSASLGCERTIEYVLNENNFFEACLVNLLDAGYDFLICISAGNEAHTAMYKTNSPVFSYGDKKNLEKLDFLGLFKSKPEYCDAKYQLCFSAIDNPAVRDRIIIVASCDENSDISSYSTLGESVDIAAPGEDIYSTGFDHDYEYMSGTSMSAPFVTGTAALLFAIDKDLTGSQVKKIIIGSSEEYATLKGFNYPILNIGNAVKYVVNN